MQMKKNADKEVPDLRCSSDIIFFPHGSTALVGQTSLLKFRNHTHTHQTW